MTIATPSRPRVSSTPRAGMGALALIEARRMLRHPAPWLGLALSVWFGWDVYAHETTWAAEHYEGLATAVAPLLLGVSLASVSSFAREGTPVAEDAPLDAGQRALARLLGGLALVAVVALFVLGAAVWLRVVGGLELGQEPGRTEHAYYTVPELLEPVLLAAFAVALGAAVVHVVRHRLVAGILLAVYWFLLGTYWLFSVGPLPWLTPLQIQPSNVEVGPASTDPTTFPSDWLLSVPGEFQGEWVRLVVSPALAGWHDVYVVALTMLAVAVAVPGRWRRPLAVAGLLLAVGAVVMQAVVAP